MTVSEDVLAARLLLGDRGFGVSHPTMQGLPGADLCPHVLAGSGVTVESLAKTASNDALAIWRAQPYRHHIYTEDEAYAMRNRGRDHMCVCGNPQSGLGHLACWEAN